MTQEAAIKELLDTCDRPGDVLRGAGHRDIRSIANLADVKLGRLMGFYNDKVVLTDSELSRIEKTLGLPHLCLRHKQKYYMCSDKDMSIVRYNLLTQKGYSSYCGNDKCSLGMPRTSWAGGQFKCGCGWISAYPQEFIALYLENKQFL